MLAAVLDLLPVAIAVTISPFPPAAAIVVLGSGDDLAPGISFAVGWVVGLIVLAGPLAGATVEALAFGLSPGPWLQILAGAGLLYAGFSKWQKRPRTEEEVTEPGWMVRLDGVAAGRSFGIGLAMGAANPKNIVLSAAAVGTIANHDLSGPGIWLATLAFVAIGSTSVIWVVLVKAIGGPRGARLLVAMKRFLLRNSNVILMAIFVLVGLKVLADGILTLAR